MLFKERKGVKPQYGTPQLLKDEMKKYFEICEEDGDKFPDEAGMMLFLGLIAEKDREKFTDDSNPNAEEYRKVFRWAGMMRETWLNEKIASAENCKSINAYIHLLKQEKNGGYIDKSGDKGGKTELKIKIDGVGGMAAFE